MKRYFEPYKPFLQFLAKFFGSYLLLTFLYQWYLARFDAAAFETDGFTDLVSRQVNCCARTLGYHTSIEPHPSEPSWLFLLNGKAVVRIVEGCNAASVMILFTAFIIAFGNGFKKTVLFILGGVLLIHVMNVLRIALLALGLYFYPKMGGFLHDILFPLIIYGIVFLLWIIWVRKFSPYGKAKV